MRWRRVELRWVAQRRLAQLAVMSLFAHFGVLYGDSGSGMWSLRGCSSAYTR